MERTRKRSRAAKRSKWGGVARLPGIMIVRTHLLVEKTQSKKVRVREAIFKAISGVQTGVCYAAPLCLAVR